MFSAERLSALPIGQRADATVAAVEDQWFDRKSIRIAPKELAGTVVAMANADGGTICIGVHDGRLEGTDAHQQHCNELMQVGMDLVQPPARLRSQLIDVIDEQGQPNHLLLIEVASSTVVHTTTADVCYLRVGDEDRKLHHDQRQELIYDKGQSHYDGIVLPRVAPALLDPTEVEGYTHQIGGEDVIRTLTARTLLTPDGGVTMGAWLLFALHPQNRFPEAYVRVLRFDGTTRSTG